MNNTRVITPQHSSPTNKNVHQKPEIYKPLSNTNSPSLHNTNYKFDCGAVPYGRATADNANAAQVDRVNVANGFRQTHKLQVVESTQRSEVSRPSFNEVFRASLSTCLWISVSIASMAYFWRIFEK
jgi:hypothetical protein